MSYQFAQEQHDDTDLAAGQNPSQAPWLLRAFGVRDQPIMIGHGGFHAPPNAEYPREHAPNGVEFGSTILPAFQRRGYATEVCTALMNWAHHEHKVSRFMLCISPHNAPSLRIAQCFGFAHVGAHLDERDGEEWIFVRDVNALKNEKQIPDPDSLR